MHYNNSGKELILLVALGIFVSYKSSNFQKKQECSDASKTIKVHSRPKPKQVQMAFDRKIKKSGDVHQANTSSIKYDEICLALDFTDNTAGDETHL